MLGGGIFVTQNKVLPGSYINFVRASTATSAVGERGTVAIALPLNFKPGEVIELTAADFAKNAKNLVGVSHDDASVIALREIFRHATKCYVYDLGEDGTTAEAIAGLDPYEYNILCAYTADDVAAYIAMVKSAREEMGKKFQVVVYNQESPDYEGVINVVSTVSDDGAVPYALVAWVAGAEAGCAINSSCTNMVYDGEYTVATTHTQSELEASLNTGKFVFHNVYNAVRVLEDLNSLVTTTEDKNDDFKNNQTIRVIDQIANDIAKLFNTKYIGKIPNDASGRVSLWGDIVSHHRALEEVRAIENFDASLVTVEQGNTKRSVIVNDVINVVNAMSQLYMTVVIQ